MAHAPPQQRMDDGAPPKPDAAGLKLCCPLSCQQYEILEHPDASLLKFTVSVNRAFCCLMSWGIFYPCVMSCQTLDEYNLRQDGRCYIYKRRLFGAPDLEVINVRGAHLGTTVSSSNSHHGSHRGGGGQLLYYVALLKDGGEYHRLNMGSDNMNVSSKKRIVDTINAFLPGAVAAVNPVAGALAAIQSQQAVMQQQQMMMQQQMMLGAGGMGGGMGGAGMGGAGMGGAGMGMPGMGGAGMGMAGMGGAGMGMGSAGAAGYAVPQVNPAMLATAASPGQVAQSIRTLGLLRQSLQQIPPPRNLVFMRTVSGQATISTATIHSDEIDIAWTETPKGLAVANFGPSFDRSKAPDVQVGDVLCAVNKLVGAGEGAGGIVHTRDVLAVMSALQSIGPPRLLTFRRMANGQQFSVVIPSAKMGVTLSQMPAGAVVTGFGPEYVPPQGPNQIMQGDILVSIQSAAGGAKPGAAAPAPAPAAPPAFSAYTAGATYAAAPAPAPAPAAAAAPTATAPPPAAVAPPVAAPASWFPAAFEGVMKSADECLSPSSLTDSFSGLEGLLRSAPPADLTPAVHTRLLDLGARKREQLGGDWTTNVAKSYGSVLQTFSSRAGPAM